MKQTTNSTNTWQQQRNNSRKQKAQNFSHPTRNLDGNWRQQSTQSKPTSPSPTTTKPKTDKHHYCPHCNYVRTSNGIYYMKFGEYTIQPFIKRYTLSMIPNLHIITDDDLFELFTTGIAYATKLGFKHPRFLINSAPKDYCNGQKEHQHLQICFDQEPELFDEKFSKLSNGPIAGGYLNRDLIEFRARKKNKQPETMMVESGPDDGDAVHRVPTDRISQMFSDKESFNSTINFGSKTNGKGPFNTSTSSIYMFVNLTDLVVTSVTISYG